MTDGQKLLEPAVRELVARYVNLVFSTALRLVGGDTTKLICMFPAAAEIERAAGPRWITCQCPHVGVRTILLF
jgi:hypothetical protein